ncbi:MAG: PD-(D/E)XK nuclease domain-containing protein, partial [Treponema sp.]|nr:PD-(D/E)XK nuclease domain-containing protein [Treponema sp.]
GYSGGVYTLDYPNEEVRAAFAESLLHHFLNGSGQSGSKVAIARALTEGNIDGAMEALRSIFASIPYGIQLREEKYYHTIVHLVFRMLGLFCLSEVQTAAGRIDCLVETRKYVYCFEFKLNGSAEEALAQIESREYLLPWCGSGKKQFKVGVRFDYEKRNIGEWRVKTG